MKPAKLLKEIRNRWKEIWMVRKSDKSNEGTNSIIYHYKGTL